MLYEKRTIHFQLRNFHVKEIIQSVLFQTIIIQINERLEER